MEYNFEKLKELTGYQTPADVAAHLSREGIEFFTGKRGRPYTFEAFYLAAKGLLPRGVRNPDNVQATPGAIKISSIK